VGEATSFDSSADLVQVLSGRRNLEKSWIVRIETHECQSCDGLSRKRGREGGREGRQGMYLFDVGRSNAAHECMARILFYVFVWVSKRKRDQTDLLPTKTFEESVFSDSFLPPSLPPYLEIHDLHLQNHGVQRLGQHLGLLVRRQRVEEGSEGKEGVREGGSYK